MAVTDIDSERLDRPKEAGARRSLVLNRKGGHARAPLLLHHPKLPLKALVCAIARLDQGELLDGAALPKGWVTAQPQKRRSRLS